MNLRKNNNYVKEEIVIDLLKDIDTENRITNTRYLILIAFLALALIGALYIIFTT